MKRIAPLKGILENIGHPEILAYGVIVTKLIGIAVLSFNLLEDHGLSRL